MYKILSKPNFGIALTLLLTILLSQTNIMNVFFNTVLGRTILAIIILCISYTNHLLGIISTLFVIMIFMGFYTYAENFATTIEPVTTTPLAPPNPTPVLDNEDTNALDENKYIITEGFDILGTEQNLQRGKKSNTIMVNEDMRKSLSVDPYDGWIDHSQFASIS